MISFLTHLEPALTPSLTVQNSAAGIRRTTAVTASDVACVEQELDDAIAQLGQAMLKAQADGDPAGARIYHDRQLAAIRSRTPEHQDRLHAEVNARFADELGMRNTTTKS